MKEHRLTFSMSLLQKLRHRGLCVGCLEYDELLWESLILCRQVQGGVGRNLPRMLSVSRQIATQRLYGSLASAKQCVGHFSARQRRSRSGTCITCFARTKRTRSHRTSRLSNRSPRCEALNNGVVVALPASDCIRSRGYHGHDAVHSSNRSTMTWEQPGG